MEELYNIFLKYGIPLTLIAIAGIILLGVLKYANVFSKLEESKRHIVYKLTSIGVSIIGACIYSLCTNTFNIASMIPYSLTIIALNQTFYSLFCTTSVKDVFKQILAWLTQFFKK